MSAVVGWAVVAGFSLAMGALAYGCFVIAGRNLRMARTALNAPLLDAADVRRADPRRRPLPRGMPDPATVDNPRDAAAYRDLSTERQEWMTLVGELLLVAAGASLGASIPGVLAAGWRTCPAAVALLVAAAGVLVRGSGAARWSAIAASYDRRRADLQRASAKHAALQPAKVPRSPTRPGLLRRVLHSVRTRRGSAVPVDRAS